jgi:hypothetical protein
MDCFAALTMTCWERRLAHRPPSGPITRSDNFRIFAASLVKESAAAQSLLVFLARLFERVKPV